MKLIGKDRDILSILAAEFSQSISKKTDQSEHKLNRSFSQNAKESYEKAEAKHTSKEDKQAAIREFLERLPSVIEKANECSHVTFADHALTGAEMLGSFFGGLIADTHFVLGEPKCWPFMQEERSRQYVISHYEALRDEIAKRFEVRLDALKAEFHYIKDFVPDPKHRDFLVEIGKVFR